MLKKAHSQTPGLKDEATDFANAGAAAALVEFGDKRISRIDKRVKIECSEAISRKPSTKTGGVGWSIVTRPADRACSLTHK
jgi:hypothetical protein